MNDAELVVLIVLCAVALTLVTYDVSREGREDEDDDNAG